MAKPNYAFAKRQRDLAKKQRKEAKRQKKSESEAVQTTPDPGIEPSIPADKTPPES